MIRDCQPLWLALNGPSNREAQGLGFRGQSPARRTNGHPCIESIRNRRPRHSSHQQRSHRWFPSLSSLVLSRNKGVNIWVLIRESI